MGSIYLRYIKLHWHDDLGNCLFVFEHFFDQDLFCIEDEQIPLHTSLSTGNLEHFWTFVANESVFSLVFWSLKMFHAILLLQDGPLPVISRVLTPLEGVCRSWNSSFCHSCTYSVQWVSFCPKGKCGYSTGRVNNWWYTVYQHMC